MNRFAKILHVAGWIAAAGWIVVWVQGRSVDVEGPELALHTVLALAVAALTLLSRLWTMVFLAQRAAGGDAEARRFRAAAFLTSATTLALLVAQFALAGSLLWERISPAAHAALGAALVAAHVASLLVEARALRAADRSAVRVTA